MEVLNAGFSARAADSFAASEAASPRRGLRIDQYARAQTGVWYYQVDVELRYTSLDGTSRCAGQAVAQGERQDEMEEDEPDDDVQYYSVRRRYSEFLQLYDKIKQELTALDETDGGMDGADTSKKRRSSQRRSLPAFPQKEYISPAVFGMLWRMSSSLQVLEERRLKFERILQWIEDHPVLRKSTAFTEFLGTPPQSSSGYVSLKQYSSQNWLSSLEKLSKEKEKRRRRLSSDCSSCSVLQLQQARCTRKRRQSQQETLEMMTKTTKRPRQYVNVEAVTTKQAVRMPRKKRARSDDKDEAHSDCGSTKTSATSEGVALALPMERQLLAADETAAQGESSRVSKKKKIM